MSTKTEQHDFSELRQEVINLRSFVIGMAGKDLEGDYNPEFVKHTLRASQEEPVGAFEDAQSFLAALQ